MGKCIRVNRLTKFKLDDLDFVKKGSSYDKILLKLIEDYEKEVFR